MTSNKPNKHLVLVKVMRDLQRKNGVLTREDLVNEARNPAHPMHSWFEWDDSVAGELYRLEQAQSFIASYLVEYVKGPPGSAKTVRARFVHVHPRGANRKGQPGYKETLTLNAREKLELLDDELGRVESMIARGVEVLEGIDMLPQFKKGLQALIAKYLK